VAQHILAEQYKYSSHRRVRSPEDKTNVTITLEILIVIRETSAIILVIIIIIRGEARGFGVGSVADIVNLTCILPGRLTIARSFPYIVPQYIYNKSAATLENIPPGCTVEMRRLISRATGNKRPGEI